MFHIDPKDEWAWIWKFLICWDRRWGYIYIGYYPDFETPIREWRITA